MAGDRASPVIPGDGGTVGHLPSGVGGVQHGGHGSRSSFVQGAIGEQIEMGVQPGGILGSMASSAWGGVGANGSSSACQLSAMMIKLPSWWVLPMAADTAKPEGPQAFAWATRQEGSRAAAGGEAAAHHPGGNYPAGAAPRTHAWVEEVRCPDVVVFVAGSARAAKEAQEKVWFTEEKEHQNLIQSVKTSSAAVIKFYGGSVVLSQHKRKLRCLKLCPVNDQLVATSWYG